MSDDNPYQSPREVTAPPDRPAIEGLPADFKDRSTGLIVFGMLEILAGLCVALMIPLMIAGTLMGATQPASRVMIVAPVVVIYGLLAVAGVWLGVGSIRARRWARSLSLVLGWMWLVMGTVATVAMLFMLPTMAASGPRPMPAAAAVGFFGAMLGMLGCMYVAAPLAVVLFYGSRNVEATCRLRDPNPNWTDRCPLPVLALSLVLGFWALTTLGGMGANYVLPLFGTYLSGPAGAAAYLLLGAAFAYLAVATYRLRPHAWWLTAIMISVWGASSAVTWMVAGPLELYRRIGMPPEQIQALEQSQMPLTMMGLGGALFALALAGYAVWLKRYFLAPDPLPDGDPDGQE